MCEMHTDNVIERNHVTCGDVIERSCDTHLESELYFLGCQ